MRSRTIGRLIAIAAVSATTCLLAGENCRNEAAVTCMVKLGKNGGTGGDNYVTATIGKPMPTPHTAPKRMFYTFEGYWDTVKADANGNPIGKQYYDAGMNSVRKWDKKAPATLWAKWSSDFAFSKIMSDWTSIAWFSIILLVLMAIAGWVERLVRRIFHVQAESPCSALRPREMSAETSNKIRNLGFVCAVFVLLLHASIGYKAASGTFAGWIYISTVRCCQIAVPTFMLISGFLLVGHFGDSGWYRSAMSKRLKTLLVPFVVWSLIWIVYMFCRTVVENALCSQPISSGLQPWMDNSEYMGLNPVMHPMLGPLWYVRALLFLAVASPVLVWMLARGKWFMLACAFLVFAFHPGYSRCAGSISYTFVYFLGFGDLFFFAVGMALRLGCLKMPGRACMIAVGLCGIAILCGCNAIAALHFSGKIMLEKVLCAFALPFLVCLAWQLVPSRKWPSWLTGMSFPIYLVHWFVMNLHGHLFVDRIETYGQLFFKVGFMAAGTLVIVAVLRLLPRKAYEVLFGGR